MAGAASSGGSGGGVLSARVPGSVERPGTDGGSGPGWDEPLQRLALALVRAVSLDDVAAALVAYGTVSAGARWAHALLLDDVGSLGVSLLGGPAVPTRRLDDLDLDAATPWNDALRTGRRLVFPSARALRRAYPALQPLVDGGLGGEGPVVVSPLTALGEARGAVTFGFESSPSGGGAAIVDAPLDQIAELAWRAGARAAIYAS